MLLPVNRFISGHWPPSRHTVQTQVSLLFRERETLSVGIDFLFERTNMALGGEYLYGYVPDLSDAMPGAGAFIPVVPGTTLYIQKLATTTSFLSDIQALVAPERPLLSTVAPNPVTEVPVPVDIAFSGSVTGFSAGEIFVQNGFVESLVGNYTAHIQPLSQGMVTVFIPANVVAEGNFTSFTLGFNYQEVTSMNDPELGSIIVFPTVVSDLLFVKTDAQDDQLGYRIVDVRGVEVKSGEISGAIRTINVESLEPGSYILHLTSRKQESRIIRFIKN